MLSQLLSLLALAATALAVPGTLAPRDARNCTFKTHITEKCASRPTPTKLTYAHISNLLTPSMSAVPVPAEDTPISSAPLTVHLASRNELIDGDLSVERPVGGDGEVHFAWEWVNPSTHAPETVTWSEGDDGKETRYGCSAERGWSGEGIVCDKVGAVEQRDMTLSCFFKCRN